MWCTRYYARIRSAKQIFNIKNSVLRCLSENANCVNSNEKVEDVNNPAICHDLSSLTNASHPDERGYVEESRLNPSPDTTCMQHLQKPQTNSYNLMPITFVDDLNICDEDIKVPRALDPCNEDVSYIGPAQLPSYNIAKYANSSRTIQELIKLGVELYKHESDVELMEFLLGADFQKDLFPYIRFLHDCGVPADYFGQFFTKNPYIFKQDMDDLHTRIRYLRFHQFDIKMIKMILCKYPKWLNYSTKFIDTRLGYFQHDFKLNGQEVRKVTVSKPKLITYKMSKINENTFAIKEEMGFDEKETKTLLLKLPDLWIKSRKNIVNTFDYAHNEMMLSHAQILCDPCILVCRKSRLEHRHTFLKKLGRAQYDPTEPLYVSFKSLICGTDVEFLIVAELNDHHAGCDQWNAAAKNLLLG
ncbi:hypothetical protein KPH14_006836 [Odynerus spinipes]|uniref:Transcription termination factor 3, mitochondrial n=1 Tax=Odynerus spinipes TaxID=1348599 RepID=A0AAD9RRC6_9HYME|nr:hypothetical protein KPH14_006836 [Odynerus spinipes]